MSVQIDKISFIKNNFNDGDTLSSHQINQIKNNVEDLLRSRKQQNNVNQADIEEDNTSLQNYIHNKPFTFQEIIKEWDGIIKDTSIVFDDYVWIPGSDKWNLLDMVGGILTFQIQDKIFSKQIVFLNANKPSPFNPNYVYFLDSSYEFGLNFGKIGSIYDPVTDSLIGVYIFSKLIMETIGDLTLPLGFYSTPLREEEGTLLSIKYYTVNENLKYTELFNRRKVSPLNIPIIHAVSNDVDLSIYPKGTPLLILNKKGEIEE